MAPRKDDIWRRVVNNLPELPELGDGPPEIETIPKKQSASSKLFVQKIVTEVYVYTDLKRQAFSEATFQDLYILGEMSEAKLKKLLAAEAIKRHKDVDTE